MHRLAPCFLLALAACGEDLHTSFENTGWVSLENGPADWEFGLHPDGTVYHNEGTLGPGGARLSVRMTSVRACTTFTPPMCPAARRLSV